MKKLFSLTLFLALLTLSLSAQRQYAGRWWVGMLQEANLALNLTFDNDGNPILYSPMQSPDPIIPSTWSFRGDTLALKVASLQVSMTLKYDSSSSLFAGSFKQGLGKMAVTLTPSEGLYRMVRPQEPQPPYHFEEEEVEVTRTDKAGRHIKLTGTLTYPKSTVKGLRQYPAVLLVSGSGQQNRDEEIFGHKPFLLIADYFAQRGIAVLRYDDRGTGGSLGDVKEATTYDLADDAEAMFDFLRKSKHVKSYQVGIMGHSEGGTIAPMIAARNKHVSFVVTLAGPGCTSIEVLLQQNEALALGQGMPDSLVAIRCDWYRSCFEAVRHFPETKYDSVFKAELKKRVSHLTSQECKAAELTGGNAYLLAQQMTLPWMKTFITLDPMDYLSQVKCRMLALNGEKDVQVLAKPNLEAIKRLTRGKAETLLLPGLNHLFQHCSTGLPNEYALIEETFSPEALEMIADWILKR